MHCSTYKTQMVSNKAEKLVGELIQGLSTHLRILEQLRKKKKGIKYGLCLQLK